MQYVLLAILINAAIFAAAEFCPPLLLALLIGLPAALAIFYR